MSQRIESWLVSETDMALLRQAVMVLYAMSTRERVPGETVGLMAKTVDGIVHRMMHHPEEE